MLKTEGFNDGDQVEYTVNTKEIVAKYTTEPPALNHDSTSGSVEVELKHGNDSSMECNGTLSVGGYDVAGMVPYSTLGWELKRGAPSGGKCPFGYKLTWSEAMKYQDFHLGFESVFDDIKEGRKWAYINSAYAFLAYTGAQNAYFRSACLNKIIALGTWGKHNGIDYAVEAQVNLNKDYKGGVSETMPVTIKAAQKWKIQNVGIHAITTMAGGAVTQKDTLSVPLGKATSAKVQCQYDVKQLFTAPGSAVSGLGLTIEYKL